MVYGHAPFTTGIRILVLGAGMHAPPDPPEPQGAAKP
jgi:hypothetical protein